MTDPTLPVARLRSLIGDDVRELATEVAQHLERLLERNGMRDPTGLRAAVEHERPRTPLDIANHLDACIFESGGDPGTLAEALRDVTDPGDLRRIAQACGLSFDVLQRQLSGRRTLTFSTVLGALRALGVELRVSVGTPVP